MATPNMMGSVGPGVPPQISTPVPAAPVMQTSPVPTAQPAYQPAMNPQMYQGPNQRRPSTFMPPAPVAAAGYHGSPAAPQYAVQQPAHFSGHNFPPARTQSVSAPQPAPLPPPPQPAPVYNPNAPRPVEVYHLNDAANNAIPPEVRSQFHCDEQGHVLFFSAPPLDLVPPAETKLSHSLKYLAAKEERRKKVTEYKRKFLEEKAQREESRKRQRADEEDTLARQVETLLPRALLRLTDEMAAGTAQLYKDLYGDRADLVHEANELKRQLEVQKHLENQKRISQMNAETKDEGYVSLKKSGLYLGD